MIQFVPFLFTGVFTIVALVAFVHALATFSFKTMVLAYGAGIAAFACGAVAVTQYGVGW